jgi:Zn-dependent protease with chaperone function
VESLYPPGPAADTQHLAKPTNAYKRHAWLAMLGLLVFVVLYIVLTAWFAWTAYRLFTLSAVVSDPLFYWVVGASSAFLAVFMAKALIFVKHGGEIDDVEITQQDEPQLFNFLYKLADDVGAPRPHRVFLSPRVNACVFYDLSLANLLFPSKKNLEIGLGLVNVLSISELKAVLAHEFGHFAQKSMAVGRWVYIAQQIAAHIIAKRDALDKLLRFISRIDLRIAWIGWILTLIVWSLRACMETAFNIVVIAERALSREMEFQADLVAVSVTGSDALIHALYKLQAADDAWDRAQSFASGELKKGAATQDLFAIQLRVLKNMAAVLDDPGYGKVPALPKEKCEQHRLFTADIAQPPRMWSTHPFSHEREQNAKKQYIPCAMDDRSAWDIFKDAEALKRRVSAHLLSRFEAKEKDLADSLAVLDQQYQAQYLKNIYRGVYMGRSLVRHAKQPQELYGGKADNIADAFHTLYPNSLTEDLQKLRNLEKEEALLRALYDGTYKAPDGIIRHRDDVVSKKDLPDIIESVKREKEIVQNTITQHDVTCRSVHLTAAEQLGQGWRDYLCGLIDVLHYTDHSEANLSDAYGYVNNVVAVITADRHVSSRELNRLVAAAGELYQTLAQVYHQANEFIPDQTLREKLKIDSWEKTLGEFTLPPPTRENINDWMGALDSWVGAACNALSGTYSTALELLLLTETNIVRWLKQPDSAPKAPQRSYIPQNYQTLTPGSERKRQKKLDLWDRFQTADGFIPGLFRFVVAGSIVGSALALGIMMT